MNSELIGGMLVGAALGVLACVAAIRVMVGRMSAQGCVRMAARFLEDLEGSTRDEIIQLFRARAALHELGKLDAASQRSALRDTDLQPTANSLQPNP